jgi:lipoate-protein ligase A
MNWQFKDTGYRSGVFNMECDEALAHALVSGEGHPTIRVYGWQPQAISIGWNQSLAEIDQVLANAVGIDVVRRPTGGRAILHWDELTYCVVMRVQGKNVLAVYEEISRALIAGLNILGVDAAMEKSQPHFPSLYQMTSGVACFSSAGRYEIKYQGKKLVGSAQRRYAAGREEVVLQHGSILIGSEHKKIATFLSTAAIDQRKSVQDELDAKTTELNSILQRKVTFDEVSCALLQGFRNAWSIDPEIVSHVRKEQVIA